MQFKLGKHITAADMMREAGERASRKSQRRNVFRELKNFGKEADEKRKKLEGRGGSAGFRTRLGAKRYNDRMEKIMEQAGYGYKNMHKPGHLYGPPEKSEKKEEKGRGGYSYKDIHKTPLSKLVAATHGHKHEYEWEDGEAQCTVCGKSMEQAEPKKWEEAVGRAEARAEAERKGE